MCIADFDADNLGSGCDSVVVAGIDVGTDALCRRSPLREAGRSYRSHMGTMGSGVGHDLDDFAVIPYLHGVVEQCYEHQQNVTTYGL